jgi:hypothetical protein
MTVLYSIYVDAPMLKPQQIIKQQAQQQCSHFLPWLRAVVIVSAILKADHRFESLHAVRFSGLDTLQWSNSHLNCAYFSK